jgi:predicted Ser/Thr protein kinase
MKIDRYRVEKFLGDGTFGRVLLCSYKEKEYAIKIIRPVERYIRSAKVEASILQKIRAKLGETPQIVCFKEYFYYEIG